MMKTFIDEAKIEKILKDSKNPNSGQVRAVIKKAKKLKGLSCEDTALLLECKDKEVIESIFNTARYIKEQIYGDRLVLFAPIYLSNSCINNCLYCGFRKDNQILERRHLTLEEIAKEVEFLESQGHKRLLLVAGQSPEVSKIEYLEKVIKLTYHTKKGPGAIRRLNVNVAPLSTSDFKRLKKAGIGTYQLFQETYHEETYKKMHPNGPKSDYQNRIYAMDKAQEAGIDDVGIGVLFGLYDYKFEVLALLAHSLYLEEKFGVGPHTISVPRVKPALNAPLANQIPYPVCDEDFKKLIAVIRLAVPYTGMILSTREPDSLRNELFTLGISQISAGSRTSPGAYSEDIMHDPASEQFCLEDTRTQLEVVKDVVKRGILPSFCTACYRTGRTGKDFMDLAKPGEIKNLCLPNCILTFKEYILDYGDHELCQQAEQVIQTQIDKISNPSIRKKTINKIKEIEGGKRDLYF